MGILAKILRSSVISGGSLPVFDDFWYNAIGGSTKSGVSINEESALKYLTVFACVSLISGDIARLPLKLYRRNPDESKTRILDHPLSDILHNAPNKDTTSFHFREAAQNHLLLWGNTFSEIKRASYSGNIIGLEQITTPGQMSIKKEKKGVYYIWQDKKGKHRKLKKDIFHIAGFGFNGQFGMSMIALAREAIGLGLAAEEFGSTYFGEGTHPAGIYEMDGYLGDNKKQFTKALKKGYAGLGKSHSIMIAEGGAKYKPLTIPLEDAQFLQCVTPDTLLSMADGTRKEAKNIQIDDLVIGWENNAPIAAKIKAVGKPETKKLVKIKTARGRELIASEDHPCLTIRKIRTAGGRKAPEKQEWIQIKNLNIGNYVKIGFGIPETKKKLSFDKAYFLGAMVGDGYIRYGGYSFSSIDNGTVEKMKEIVHSMDGEIQKKKGENCDWNIITNAGARRATKIGELLNKAELIGKHSDTKRVPKSVMSGGLNAWKGFLSGYFDTDGSIRDVNGLQNVALYWSSVNRLLLEDCQHLLTLLGVQSSIYPMRPGGKIKIMGRDCNALPGWGLYVTGNSQLKKLSQILILSHIEKAKRLSAYLDLPDTKYRDLNFIYDRIVSVEEAGQGETIGIEVTGCHTHITSGIVTHNTRDHQKIEICGMYHVPPHKIALHGQNSNYNNLEQENAGYVDSCLMHWIVRWEQSIALQLLTPEERRSGLFVEFLVDGLLRGDSQARGEFYNKMFQVGALSPNNILAKENMNPVEGGDQHFVQLNMIPLNMAGTFAKPDEENKSLREYRAKSSILVRDRIAKQYYPLFQRAAQDIVNKEGLAVKKQINQQRKKQGSMQIWLDDFYRKLPEDIRAKLGPVIKSFSEAIEAATIDEIGVDTESIEDFINDYIDRYTERHVDSSLGQLTALLEEDLEALKTRVDEWAETRAQKIATNETVRASNGVYQAVAFGVGLSTIWRIRGAKTCPYCRSLNGKRVSSGQSFVKDGEELNPEGAETPMKIRGMKAHPPLHRACDCYLSI